MNPPITSTKKILGVIFSNVTKRVNVVLNAATNAVFNSKLFQKRKRKRKKMYYTFLDYLFNIINRTLRVLF